MELKGSCELQDVNVALKARLLGGTITSSGTIAESGVGTPNQDDFSGAGDNFSGGAGRHLIVRRRDSYRAARLGDHIRGIERLLKCSFPALRYPDR